MITVERAKQIAENLHHEMMMSYPKGPRPHPEMTPSEDAEIKAYWNTIDGSYSYYGAVQKMARGDHLRRKS